MLYVSIVENGQKKVKGSYKELMVNGIVNVENVMPNENKNNIPISDKAREAAQKFGSGIDHLPWGRIKAHLPVPLAKQLTLAQVETDKALSSTPQELQRMFVRREVLEKCVETIEIIGSQNHNLECPECCVCKAVDETLTFAKQELEEK